MEDDYGTSYYYRGAVTNNYVKFGKWNENTPAVYRGYLNETDDSFNEYTTLAECQNAKNYNVNCTIFEKAGRDMYWRIIRINGDGSLRIIYTGTQAYINAAKSTDMFIGTESAWNSEDHDAKYVGWMYGGVKGEASTSKEQAQKNETDSDIKKVVDTWYKENFVDTRYADAIADVLFCNDRSTPGDSISEWRIDTGLGYGNKTTAYGAFGRFKTGNNGTYANTSARSNITPIFKCPEKNDSFTVDDTIKGNGDLTYPVGLITADEVVAAGSGKYGTGNNSYLYRPASWYRTLSPAFYTINDQYYGYIFMVNNYQGMLGQSSVINPYYSIAPVINLSAEYVKTLEGTGTADDPYRSA